MFEKGLARFRRRGSGAGAAQAARAAGAVPSEGAPSSGTRRRPSWTLAAAPLLLVSLMAGLADRLVYFPVQEHDGGTPAMLGLAHEDVEIAASDGVKIHGWLVPAAAPENEKVARSPAGEPRAPTVLFLHGNGGNISHRLDKLAVLHGLGASVLMIDYRGYGRSDGSPDEAGLYRDADAAYDELLRRGRSADSIVLYGESLGGTVATELAARRPVAALVLESTPTSILEVARHHYPILPVSLFLAARYDALSRIARVNAPILLLHSREDEIVPFTMAEEMLLAAPEPKWLVALRGGHNDCFLRSAETYERALREFLTEIRRTR